MTKLTKKQKTLQEKYDSSKVYSIFNNLHYRNLALIKDFNGNNRVLIAQA